MIARSLLAATFLSMGALASAAPPPADDVEDAPAGDPGATDDGPAVADADSERKICRTQKVTGSLSRRTRICMTQTQWRELNEHSRQGVQDFQNSASGAPACTNTFDTACGTAAGPGGSLPVPTGSGLNS